MKRRLPLLIASLALLTGCGDDPGALAPDPELARGGGGPPLIATAVAAGRLHACAVGADRTTYCWGDNTFGQLGDGTSDPSTTPVPVSGASAFEDITSGGRDHTCGLTRSGDVWCWGQNAFGQLGDGTTTDRSSPVRAAPGLTFRSVDVGTYHTCGVATDGTAYCWGANGALVQGGSQDGWAFGTPVSDLCANPVPTYRGTEWPCSTTPVAVPGPGLVSASAGLWSTCGLTSAGDAYCSGWNLLWALGNGTIDHAPAMTPVAGGLSFDDVALGALIGCGLVGTDAYCWGGRFLANGALGNGTLSGSSTPVAVSGGHAFASVHPSDANDVFSFVCGLTTGGEALCWGTNRFGGLGTDVPLPVCVLGLNQFDCSSVPVPVAGGHAFVDLATGEEFACGVGRNRHVYCWGANFAGNLGDGTTDNRVTPVAVQGPARRGRRPAPAPTGPTAILIP